MKSREVSATVFCAALYAALSLPTAWIELPWLGHGQFRPAVVIPAVFAVLFGPYVGGVGAAIGTLIADSTKHATLYIPSVMAAVPGNFVGFYVLGYLARRFSWKRFVVASVIGMTVGCVIITLGMGAYGGLFGIINLTTVAWLIPFFLWIAVTGLLSLLVLGPPLLKILFSAFPYLRPVKQGRSTR